MMITGTRFVLGLLALLSLAASGCTMRHSKQALSSLDADPPHPNATFVEEEDSGFSLLGLFELSEPDHYAVLIERARRRYRCEKVHHGQLDFFTDHWLFLSFPITRVTLICEPKPEQVGAQPATNGELPEITKTTGK